MTNKNKVQTIEATNGFKVTVYVPSTFNVSERINKSQFNNTAKAVEHAFTKRYGGATSVLGNGTYEANNGAIVSESVWLVSVFVKGALTVDDHEFFKGIAHALKVTLLQESITVTCEQIQYCFI